ncbi:MAG: ABC transporter ATP-binding protein [Gammaproteobacteria bacterium]|nr:ABC transporter ATP-binding protein [Gammaproteobacteria bacterium]
MLRFANLTKSYLTGTTEVQALKGVSAHIEQGSTVALCGPSGSGKSTLLNICGLLDPDYQGELYLGGELVPANAQALTSIRREKIGFIFQRYNLIPVMSAFENIEYPLLMLGISKAERYERVARMIDAVGLGKFAKQRPDRLSGGQQQRVAIARALVKEPRLVIADEPTANLDTPTAHLVIDLMRDLGREVGSTFIIATHDHRMTDRCDRVIELSDGHLTEQTKPALQLAWG